jgi:hypothetical protein
VSRQRKRPAPPQSQPIPEHTYAEFTALPGQDRVEALDAEDREDLAVLQAAEDNGYRIAVQCTACGRWLTSRKSLLAHMGPVCRAKQVAK